MTEENARKLWLIIQEAGDYLQGQLSDHPNHPKGRNPYAHVTLCVKNNLTIATKILRMKSFKKLLITLTF